MFPNLESLNLSFCTSLAELHPSVGFLDKLVHFNLRNCYNLEMFPRIVNMKSLQDINFEDCKRLENFPEIVGRMESLTSMNVSGTAHQRSAFICWILSLQFHQKEKVMMKQGNLDAGVCNIWDGYASALRVIDLSAHNFVSLPACIGKFFNLWQLNLNGCKRLREVPELPPSWQGYM
ncbi:hypothetical protein M0R45_027379 [Rubus argutus]|uniref:Uncharacterized protein n=1 Tax=Rubus argutus TaxID=59490 RepID=A0AAW1X1Y0_RUBAR